MMVIWLLYRFWRMRPRESNMIMQLHIRRRCLYFYSKFGFLLRLWLIAAELLFIPILLVFVEVKNCVFISWFQVFYNTARYYRAYYGHKTVRFVAFAIGSSDGFWIRNWFEMIEFCKWHSFCSTSVLFYLPGSPCCVGRPSSYSFRFSISKSINKV